MNDYQNVSIFPINPLQSPTYAFKGPCIDLCSPFKHPILCYIGARQSDPITRRCLLSSGQTKKKT